MTTASEKDWPPIIRGVALPNLVIWRDRLITAAMWLLLFWFCRHALWAVAAALLNPLDSERHLESLRLAERWTRLQPYFIVIGLFALWLAIWMLATLRRARRNLLLPQPPALALEDEARKAGCSPTDLSQWRGLRVCTARLDDTGALSVVAKGQQGG